MLEINNDQFYSRLPINEIPLGELLMEDHLFYKMPENWHVVITDVKNSTAAVKEGLYQTINLVATGSIVAVLNLAHKANISVPFFFGGDGATFIIPPTLLNQIMKALMKHSENTRNNFNLELRVGHIPVAEIYNHSEEIRISKLKTTSLFSIPVILGNGLTYAEKKIKGPDYLLAAFEEAKEEPDLSGMQCRWDRIKPPEDNFEVLSLIVIARSGVKQSFAFKKVIECVDTIFGGPHSRKPISVGKLKLKSTLARIGLEMRVRMGTFRPDYLFLNWTKTLLGYFYFKTKKGKRYLHNLVELADTLVIDGKINTVISGNAVQREKLEAALNELERKGEIIYGIYKSKESVMSCYVRNMNDRHIHFVDGAVMKKE